MLSLNIKQNELGPSGVLALGIVIAAIIGAYAFYSVHALSNTLTVTGSATATSTADIAKLTVSVSRPAYEGSIADVQSRVASDARAVVDFLVKDGFDRDAISESAVSIDREYSSDSNAPIKYSIREEVSFQSNDPRHVERVSKTVSDLSSRGILVNVSQPQYYISNLAELRISLVGEAVKDAKARAESIAKSAGQHVGRLQSAASGVVQVMAPNSVDVADYGSYDTSTIEKQVMVTTKAVFLVR